jgi:hypothetical protein
MFVIPTRRKTSARTRVPVHARSWREWAERVSRPEGPCVSSLIAGNCSWFVSGHGLQPCRYEPFYSCHPDRPRTTLSEAEGEASGSGRIPGMNKITTPHQGILSTNRVASAALACTRIPHTGSDTYHVSGHGLQPCRNKPLNPCHPDRPRTTLSEAEGEASRSGRIPGMNKITTPHQGVFSTNHVTLPSSSMDSMAPPVTRKLS